MRFDKGLVRGHVSLTLDHRPCAAVAFSGPLDEVGVRRLYRARRAFTGGDAGRLRMQGERRRRSLRVGAIPPSVRQSLYTCDAYAGANIGEGNKHTWESGPCRGRTKLKKPSVDVEGTAPHLENGLALLKRPSSTIRGKTSGM